MIFFGTWIEYFINVDEKISTLQMKKQQEVDVSFGYFEV